MARPLAPRGEPVKRTSVGRTRPSTVYVLSLCAILLLLNSCATKPPSAATTGLPPLPADVTMNENAGRGGHLFVTLRLESGEELPAFVDTGSPMTVLDKSL